MSSGFIYFNGTINVLNNVPVVDTLTIDSYVAETNPPSTVVLGDGSAIEDNGLVSCEWYFALEGTNVSLSEVNTTVELDCFNEIYEVVQTSPNNVYFINNSTNIGENSPSTTIIDVQAKYTEGFGTRSNRESVLIGSWSLDSKDNSDFDINKLEFWWMSMYDEYDLACEWRIRIYHTRFFFPNYFR